MHLQLYFDKKLEPLHEKIKKIYYNINKNFQIEK
jgi:hypothetical protein